MQPNPAIGGKKAANDLEPQPPPDNCPLMESHDDNNGENGPELANGIRETTGTKIKRLKLAMRKYGREIAELASAKIDLRIAQRRRRIKEAKGMFHVHILCVLSLLLVLCTCLLIIDHNCTSRTQIPIAMKLKCPADYVFSVEVEQPIDSTPWLDYCVTSAFTPAHYSYPENIPCSKLKGSVPASLLESGMCFAQRVTYRNKKIYTNPEDEVSVDVIRTYLYHCRYGNYKSREKTILKTNVFIEQTFYTSNYYSPEKMFNVMKLFGNDSTPSNGNKTMVQTPNPKTKRSTDSFWSDEDMDENEVDASGIEKSALFQEGVHILKNTAKIENITNILSTAWPAMYSVIKNITNTA